MTNIENFTRIRFAITNRCNLNCRYCFMRSNEVLYRELSTDKILRILELLKERTGVKYLTFTGGEPLLRGDLATLLLKARDMGYNISISTNGILLHRNDLLSVISKTCNYVTVGLDGSNPTINGLTRDSRYYNKIIENISLAIKKGIIVCVNTVLTRLNINDILNLIKLCDKLGVRCIHVSKPIIAGRAKNMSKHMLLTSSMVREFLAKLAYLVEEESIEVVVTLDMWFLIALKRQKQSTITTNLLFSGPACEMTTTLSVLPDGSLTPCLAFHTLYRTRSIIDYGLEHALDELYRIIDSILSTLDVKSCRLCDIFELCLGGCKVNALAFNKSKDPLCLECVISGKKAKSRT